MPSPALQPAESAAPDTEPSLDGSGIYFAYIDGSYCAVDAVIADPQSVSSAYVEAVDGRSGETLEAFELPREDIDTGHWSTVFMWVPQDIAAYEQSFGEGALPVVTLRMTVDREGATADEEYIAKKSCGSGPEIRYDIDAERGAYGIKLFGSGAGDAELVFALNGTELSGDAVSVSDGTEEVTVSRPGSEPTVEQREYRLFTVSLPQPLQDGDILTFTLRIEIGGHEFEYTRSLYPRSTGAA